MLLKVSEPKKYVMYKVLYVPKLSHNLFSVRTAASKGNFIRFRKSRCWIRDGTKRPLGMGTLEDQFYRLNCEAVQPETSSASNAQKEDTSCFRLKISRRTYIVSS